MARPATRTISRARRGEEGRRHPAQVPLAALLAVGAAAVWLAIPIASLWLLSQASDDYLTVYLGALLVSGPAMAGWGWFLHRVIRAPAVLKLSAEIAVAAAFAGFAVWVLFFGAHGNGAAPGAW